MIQTDAGSLQAGDTFWYHDMKFEVTANNGSRYVEAAGVESGIRLHIEHDEDVEVESGDD